MLARSGPLERAITRRGSMAWTEYIVQRDIRAATSEKYENNAASRPCLSRDPGHVRRGCHAGTDMPAEYRHPLSEQG